MMPNDRPSGRKAAGPGVPPSSGTTPPTPARPAVRRDPPPPPIVAYEDVIAACGHPEKFGLFEDRKDKFRKDRRKKVTERPCKACREQIRLAEEVATQARRVEKQQRAAERAQAVKSLKPAEGHSERLPDGSKFEVVYDAARKQWSGTLTIGGQVFTDSSGGVFKLLHRLDRQYRKSRPPEPPREPG